MGAHLGGLGYTGYVGCIGAVGAAGADRASVGTLMWSSGGPGVGHWVLACRGVEGGEMVLLLSQFVGSTRFSARVRVKVRKFYVYC